MLDTWDQVQSVVKKTYPRCPTMRGTATFGPADGAFGGRALTLGQNKMKYGVIAITCVIVTGCAHVAVRSDPGERIAALVVAGRYEDAIAAFSRLPPETCGVSYVRAADAASLAYAILAARESDPTRRDELFDKAIGTFPNITMGRGRTPFDQRQELKAAQAAVEATIMALKAETRMRESPNEASHAIGAETAPQSER